MAERLALRLSLDTRSGNITSHCSPSLSHHSANHFTFWRTASCFSSFSFRYHAKSSCSLEFSIILSATFPVTRYSALTFRKRAISPRCSQIFRLLPSFQFVYVPRGRSRYFTSSACFFSLPLHLFRDSDQNSLGFFCVLFVVHLFLPLGNRVSQFVWPFHPRQDEVHSSRDSGGRCVCRRKAGADPSRNTRASQHFRTDGQWHAKQV